MNAEVWSYVFNYLKCDEEMLQIGKHDTIAIDARLHAFID